MERASPGHDLQHDKEKLLVQSPDVGYWCPKAGRRAEEAYRLFLAATSHGVRKTVASVLGYVNLLCDLVTDEASRKYLIREADDAQENTRWLYETNLPGPPFMEALIYRPFGLPGFRKPQEFRGIPQE